MIIWIYHNNYKLLLSVCINFHILDNFENPVNWLYLISDQSRFSINLIYRLHVLWWKTIISLANQMIRDVQNDQLI